MDVLNVLYLGKPLWMWATFVGLVVFLLALDLGLVHRKNKEVTVKGSLWSSAFYIAIGLGFGAGSGPLWALKAVKNT